MRDPKGFEQREVLPSSFTSLQFAVLQCACYSMDRSHSDANSYSPSRVISRLVRNLKFHYCFHKILPLALIPSQINSTHTILRIYLRPTLISFAFRNCFCSLDLPIKVLYAFLISPTQFKRYTGILKTLQNSNSFPSCFQNSFGTTVDLYKSTCQAPIWCGKYSSFHFGQEM